MSVDAFMGEMIYEAEKYEDMIKKGELQRIYDGDVVIRKKEIQKRADFKELAEMILEFSDVVFMPLKICGKEQQEQYAGDYCKRLGQAIVQCLARLVFTEKELEKCNNEQAEMMSMTMEACQNAIEEAKEQSRKETAREIYIDYEKEIKATYGAFDKIDAFSILEWLKEICEKHGADFADKEKDSEEE